MESIITLKPDGSIRRLKSTNRVGAPRLFWTEISLSEASTRVKVSEVFGVPYSAQLNSSFFANITRKHVDEELGKTL